jgi:hypothetical protein
MPYEIKCLWGIKETRIHCSATMQVMWDYTLDDTRAESGGFKVVPKLNENTPLKGFTQCWCKSYGPVAVGFGGVFACLQDIGTSTQSFNKAGK